MKKEGLHLKIRSGEQFETREGVIIRNDSEFTAKLTLTVRAEDADKGKNHDHRN